MPTPQKAIVRFSFLQWSFKPPCHATSNADFAHHIAATELPSSARPGRSLASS